MTRTDPVRPAVRRARSGIAVVLVMIAAALLGDLAYQSLATPSSSAAPLVRTEAKPSPLLQDVRTLGSDGEVPDGTTIFDDVPAVDRIKPDLLRPLRRAATAARLDGVAFYVNSGWRSKGYQGRLFREAVSKYGSSMEAARWVATPGTSAHEAGDAVDIGHTDATVWLSEHGADFGLCQTYGNEPWHFELRTDAIDEGCPTPYADPTHDPRMRQ